MVLIPPSTDRQRAVDDHPLQDQCSRVRHGTAAAYIPFLTVCCASCSSTGYRPWEVPIRKRCVSASKARLPDAHHLMCLCVTPVGVSGDRQPPGWPSVFATHSGNGIFGLPEPLRKITMRGMGFQNSKEDLPEEIRNLSL